MTKPVFPNTAVLFASTAALKPALGLPAGFVRPELVEGGIAAQDPALSPVDGRIPSLRALLEAIEAAEAEGDW